MNVRQPRGGAKAKSGCSAAWLRRVATGGRLHSVNPNVTYIYLHNRVPALTYRFTVEQFQRLADAGILTRGESAELIDGQVVADAVPRRFTTMEYMRMGETGILQEDERVELLDGEIILMSPIGYRHAATVNHLTKLFVSRAKDRYIVSIQNPIDLPGNFQPQPDVVLVKPDFVGEDHHPHPAEIFLLIEVADSSLGLDQHTKLPQYAEAEVAEFWIVNLTKDEIEIYRRPAFDHYEERLTARRGETVSCAAFPELKIPVNKILP